jgi:hypothetical protein
LGNIDKRQLFLSLEFRKAITKKIIFAENRKLFQWKIEKINNRQQDDLLLKKEKLLVR